MRKILGSFVLAGALMLVSSPAQAQVSGNVYQIVPQGVYIQNSNGISFVPSSSASFRVGNQQVHLNTLPVGAPVNAYMNSNYQPQYVPVEYYQQHPNWDWNRHVSGWQQDRKNWHHDNGRWHNQDKWEKKHHKHKKDHHDNGRRKGHDRDDD